jgi:S-adenosylmethionine:diacylglycerol 3-amino-3-carboxypropyl transferase
VGRGEPRLSGTTAWRAGRFDARCGPQRVLFGRMYEDAAIECAAFPAAGRIFCIASAGCTAMALALRHEVVAVDINPAQLAYVARRLAGAPAVRGTAERLLDAARTLAPLAGWSRRRLHTFLALDDVAAQRAFWHTWLDTRRFRFALGRLLSPAVLGAVYAAPFLRVLPPRFGTVLRARLARGFARHPNRTNPYARALLLGELPKGPPRTLAGTIQLVHADAAQWLEEAPAQSFTGFALSNLLDGADEAYRQRLFAAVRRAGRADAVVVLRSFREPANDAAGNRAADDRALLWGIVEVRPAAALA